MDDLFLTKPDMEDATNIFSLDFLLTWLPWEQFLLRRHDGGDGSLRYIGYSLMHSQVELPIFV